MYLSFYLPSHHKDKFYEQHSASVFMLDQKLHTKQTYRKLRWIENEWSFLKSMDWGESLRYLWFRVILFWQLCSANCLVTNDNLLFKSLSLTGDCERGEARVTPSLLLQVSWGDNLINYQIELTHRVNCEAQHNTEKLIKVKLSFRIDIAWDRLHYHTDIMQNMKI